MALDVRHRGHQGFWPFEELDKCSKPRQDFLSRQILASVQTGKTVFKNGAVNSNHPLLIIRSRHRHEAAALEERKGCLRGVGSLALSCTAVNKTNECKGEVALERLVVWPPTDPWVRLCLRHCSARRVSVCSSGQGHVALGFLVVLLLLIHTCVQDSQEELRNGLSFVHPCSS